MVGVQVAVGAVLLLLASGCVQPATPSGRADAVHAPSGEPLGEVLVRIHRIADRFGMDFPYQALRPSSAGEVWIAYLAGATPADSAAAAPEGNGTVRLRGVVGRSYAVYAQAGASSTMERGPDAVPRADGPVVVDVDVYPAQWRVAENGTFPLSAPPPGATAWAVAPLRFSDDPALQAAVLARVGTANGLLRWQLGPGDSATLRAGLWDGNRTRDLHTDPDPPPAPLSDYGQAWFKAQCDDLDAVRNGRVGFAALSDGPVVTAGGVQFTAWITFSLAGNARHGVDPGTFAAQVPCDVL